MKGPLGMCDLMQWKLLAHNKGDEESEAAECPRSWPWVSQMGKNKVK